MTASAPDWGTPPWQIEANLPATPAPERCTVAIVGGGLTGLSAAYHLARRGVQTALLEADTIGAGASGRTGGIVLEGTAAGPLAEVDRCLAGLAALVDEAGIACDLLLAGCWELTHRDAPGDVRPAWRDGSSYLCVGATEPGGTVDAGALLAGLARAAFRAGATIHQHCRVRRLEPGPPAALRVGTRTVVAEHVVLALNAYTTALVPLGVPLTTALTLALSTEPLDADALDALGLGERLPFYTADLPYLWGRVLPDRRLVFGAGLIFPGAAPVTTVDCRLPEAAAALARLEARVRGLHPALAGIGIPLRWGGPIAFLAHRPPLLSRLPAAPHVIVAGGYAGHGIALGVRIGALVARALVDDRPLPAWGVLA